MALNQAITLASNFGAELGLLYVVPFSPAPSPDLIPMVSIVPDVERLNTALAHRKRGYASRVPTDVKAHCEVKVGNADREIARAIEDGGFGWLVIATHGLSGWKHLIFGLVAEAVVRREKCPVSTVHAQLDEGPASDCLHPFQQELGWSNKSPRSTPHLLNGDDGAFAQHKAGGTHSSPLQCRGRSSR